jgi:hypothetical protein
VIPYRSQEQEEPVE